MDTPEDGAKLWPDADKLRNNMDAAGTWFAGGGGGVSPGEENCMGTAKSLSGGSPGEGTGPTERVCSRKT
jgi:hypothetical protein